MTRGNQREIDRARAMNRREKNAPKGADDSGLSMAQRKERDAAIMREKQKKALEGKE
eukprot:ANDGO_08273.mRNA.1 Small EDRK-rich factor 2 OS=Pongo abelii GN=SERF2 PE=3 SV=1